MAQTLADLQAAITAIGEAVEAGIRFAIGVENLNGGDTAKKPIFRRFRDSQFDSQSDGFNREHSHGVSFHMA